MKVNSEVQALVKGNAISERQAFYRLADTEVHSL